MPCRGIIGGNLGAFLSRSYPFSESPVKFEPLTGRYLRAACLKFKASNVGRRFELRAFHLKWTLSGRVRDKRRPAKLSRISVIPFKSMIQASAPMKNAKFQPTNVTQCRGAST